MRNDPDPIAKLTYIAGMVQQALALADEQGEFMIAAKLDESLHCVRERIDAIKGKKP
ncbi:hypothetical protein [Sphingomonas albertensis]|uniref:Uncharacterized protein n=1 Tax=Sphingomonas albertensis TaxID=2762591 RepID=A0ABR7AKF7_9SPHN|nr:hypothetical protein [Sphingomonas albertensis]MBC3940946.1 hypothetical protein [Sphingomonas albertensis]